MQNLYSFLSSVFLTNDMITHTHTHTHIIFNLKVVLEVNFVEPTVRYVKGVIIYKVSQEECAKLRESVPYVKV
jgi:hypothetical protein